MKMIWNLNFLYKKKSTNLELVEFDNKLKDFYNKYNEYMILDSALIELRETAYNELKNS